MNYINELFGNHMFVCALIAYFSAQIIKIILCLINERRLDMHLMFASGGMPSSHASK